MDTEFEALAMKVLGGAADAAEEAALRRRVAEDPAKAAQLQELKEALQIAGAVLPQAQALDANKTPLPEYRLEGLKSVLHRAFPAQAEQPQHFLAWLFRPRIALTAAAMMGLCFFLLQAFWVASGPVEFGTYTGYTMRGEQDPLPTDLLSRLKVRNFDTELIFSCWRHDTWLAHSKAHVWFDEEKDLIHVVKSGRFFTAPVETTHPLPTEPAQRGEALREILDGL